MNIRMAQGFCHLVAVMDWHSRFVLSWTLSVTMEMEFCLETLAAALRRGRPKTFNSDQVSQFTSDKFTRQLHTRGRAIGVEEVFNHLSGFVLVYVHTIHATDDSGTHFANLIQAPNPAATGWSCFQFEE
jgi:putative transposase